jgi:hypothetical protein
MARTAEPLDIGEALRCARFLLPVYARRRASESSAAPALCTVLNLRRSRVGKGWLVALANTAVLAAVMAFVIAVNDAIEVNTRKTELFGRTIGAQIGWGRGWC